MPAVIRRTSTVTVTATALHSRSKAARLRPGRGGRGRHPPGHGAGYRLNPRPYVAGSAAGTPSGPGVTGAAGYRYAAALAASSSSEIRQTRSLTPPTVMPRPAGPGPACNLKARCCSARLQGSLQVNRDDIPTSAGHMMCGRLTRRAYRPASPRPPRARTHGRETRRKTVYLRYCIGDLRN